MAHIYYPDWPGTVPTDYGDMPSAQVLPYRPRQKTANMPGLVLLGLFVACIALWGLALRIMFGTE